MIDRRFTLDTLTDMIRIDSRNPALEAGAPGEWELATYVEQLLTRLGWNAELNDLGDRRANVVASRSGTSAGPSLMINVHLDTVGAAGMAEPYSGRSRDGRVYGRGALDTKGGMAAVLGMARALSERDVGPGGDLVLAFVADEENESLGTRRLLERVTTDAAIVIEPTNLDICVAHRGFCVFRLSTLGRAAHGGDADLGIDANRHMGHLLVKLEGLPDAWRQRHAHPLLTPPGLHVPLVAGGRQLFMYADECVARLECRTVPGQSSSEIRRDVERTLESLAVEIDGFRGSVEPELWRSPYEIDPGRPIVRSLRSAAEAALGRPSELIGHPWWEDSGLLGDAGIDAVVVGPAGVGLHTTEEWVDAESVIDLAEILYLTVVSYGATGPGEPYPKETR